MLKLYSQKSIPVPVPVSGAEAKCWYERTPKTQKDLKSPAPLPPLTLLPLHLPLLPLHLPVLLYTGIIYKICEYKAYIRQYEGSG